ncbi:GumC family protein [Segetibacter aerophilus]|nr:tyrosine-protein kinase [Segetibacter aerophilus]
MEFTRKFNKEQSSNLLSQAIFKFLPYWPLFIGLIILGAGSAWVYLRFTTPLYETTATLLIKDEKKGAVESKTIESLDQLSSKKIIENEMEVIQSASLIHDVINQLHLYAPIYKKAEFKKISAYSTAPVQVQIEAPDDIEPIENIQFKFNRHDSSVVIDDKIYPVNTWISTTFGRIKFELNVSGKKEDGGEYSFSLIKPKSVISSIKQRLKVTTSNKMTSILNLSFIDEEPKRGEAILNELLLVYNKANVQDKNILADNTLKFIDERLKSVEQDLKGIEGKIQNYKSQQNAVDIGPQGRLFLENVSNNDQKLSDINMQLAVLGQVERYVNSSNNAIGVVPSTLGVSDPTLSKLVEKLYASELEYETLKKTTGENSPTLIAVVDRIEKIKPSIINNIQSQRGSLLATRENLSATNGMYTSVLRAIPEKERELIEINREQGIKNGIYSFLLQKKEETALSYASTVTDSRVIDKAQSSDKPVSPKKKIVYLSSVMIALLLGMGLILGRESLSRKVMFRYEIENLSELPIIGEIGIEASNDPIVISEGKKTFVAEQFRKLRMSLNYIGINSKHKKILVTSSISGEGKSFIATNLALSLALTNKKVILLDFDLNNPSITSSLNVHNEKGITEFLMGESDIHEIIQQTEHNPNLHIISTGNLPSNPTELIMNGKAEELISYLDSSFDYIIIDTAPVMPVTDAYVLSQLCDATLYVVRHNFTPKVFVERLDANNKINSLNNLAIVFNGVTARGIGGSGYGYGYGYGYIYDDRNSRKKLSYPGS